MSILNKQKLDKPTVCIVGMGYVGLPLARAFSRILKVVGFDIDKHKITVLNKSKSLPNLTFTNRPVDMNTADFIIICVPTPVNRSKKPNLSFIKTAATTVGKNMKKGSIVILESTVYPGLTEEVLTPLLESGGLKRGWDFKIAYSPERINPGDNEHTIENLTKVVAGMDKVTIEKVAELYRMIVKDVFIARDIKTAEASKLAENIQRDMNIAIMNELAVIFEKLGINTKDVLDAAATKWNFQRYTPGLVGGHCIPVVPYYLVHKAKQVGYKPRLITVGRRFNDAMPGHIVEMIIKALKEAGKTVKEARMLLIGLAYKENIADVKESLLRVVAEKLTANGVYVVGYDPLLEMEKAKKEFNIEVINDLESLKIAKVDGIILGVAHDFFKKLKLEELKDITKEKPVIIDLRSFFRREAVIKAGFTYKTL